MTVAAGNSQEIFVPSRIIARPAAMRPVLWALVWASLAHLCWTIHKVGQVRMQPDAIATGVPGFMFRIVAGPLEWSMQTIHTNDPVMLSLQAGLIVAICGATPQLPQRLVRSLGGDRAGENDAAD